jgi:hypothetical protein
VGGAGAARGVFRVPSGEASVESVAGSGTVAAAPTAAVPAGDRIPDFSSRPADVVLAGGEQPKAPARAPAPCPGEDLTIPACVKHGQRSGLDRLKVPPPAPPGLLAPLRQPDPVVAAAPPAATSAPVAAAPAPAASSVEATPPPPSVAAAPPPPATSPGDPDGDLVAVAPAAVPPTAPIVAPPPVSDVATSSATPSPEPAAEPTAPGAAPAPRRLRLVRDGLTADAVPEAESLRTPTRVELPAPPPEGPTASPAASPAAILEPPPIAGVSEPAVATPATPPPTAPSPSAPEPFVRPAPPPPASAAPSPAPVAVRPAPAPAPSTPPPSGSDSLATPPREFRFAVPRNKAVFDHAAALRAAPDDPSRPCWPTDLVRTAPASVVLSAGPRPAIVVFYDGGARASRLAAADLLPVVVELEAKVDLVLVDLTPGRKLSDDERKLVRRYYLGYVPTTVVLSAGRSRDEGGTAPSAPQERRILLLKSERVDPLLVKAAAETS